MKAYKRKKQSNFSHVRAEEKGLIRTPISKPVKKINKSK